MYISRGTAAWHCSIMPRFVIAAIAAPLFFISTFAMQKAYDARGLSPGCSAWYDVLSQGTTSSCCAAAMATSLSLRECLRDGRDTMYSAQQIWDCSGSAISSVRNGTLLQGLIDAMLESGRRFLVHQGCAAGMTLNMIESEPSDDRCENTCPDDIMQSIDVSATFKLSGDDVRAARNHMKEEIMRNGPVLAVLALPTDADAMEFRNLGAGQIFIPSTYADGAAVAYHCIVAYGWGVSETDGQEFWRVQNSYGVQWGDNGVGRVGVGALERNWKSVSTPRVECVASMNQSCLPPLLPAADALSIDGVLDAIIMLWPSFADAFAGASQNNTYHNGNKTWERATYYYYNNYYRNFNVTKLNNYYKDTLIMHYRTITTMPNSAVLGVTMVSAIVIVCLLFMFITPAEPEPRRSKPGGLLVPDSYYYYTVPPQPWRAETLRYA